MPTNKKTKPSASKVDQYIGQRVKIARNIANIPQADLAAKLGISFQQVQKYERGTNRISASRMLQIAEALDVSILYLYEDLEQRDVCNKSDSLVEKALTDKDVNQLVRSYMSIQDLNVKKSFLTMLTNIAKKSK